MLLNLSHIYKDYQQEKLVVPVLKDVSVSVEEGEYVHAGSAVGTVAGTAAFELRKDGLSVMPVFAN